MMFGAVAARLLGRSAPPPPRRGQAEIDPGDFGRMTRGALLLLSCAASALRVTPVPRSPPGGFGEPPPGALAATEAHPAFLNADWWGDTMHDDAAVEADPQQARSAGRKGDVSTDAQITPHLISRCRRR